MYSAKEPVRTRFDIVRTAAEVVTAVCLLAITITLVVGGAYTVETVHHLQSTYHPEKLGSIIADASDAIHTIHSTTTMLKSSRGGPTVMDDLNRLITSLEELSTSLNRLQVNKVLEESSSWRSMSEHFVDSVKKTLNEN